MKLTTSFTNVCLMAIICLLGVIAMRLNTAPVYAAKTSRYEVIRALDGQVPGEIQKQTQAGWELVAAPFWANSNMSSGSEGMLIFRK
jgi:hypothetical protein